MCVGMRVIFFLYFEVSMAIEKVEKPKWRKSQPDDQLDRSMMEYFETIKKLKNEVKTPPN